jgi:HrpA-like RNA helicase
VKCIAEAKILITASQSLDCLIFLGAIEKRVTDYTLTDMGKIMSYFPMDPRLSKLLVLCYDKLPDMLYESIVVCAMVTNGGHIFYRSGSQDQKNEADAKKLRFCDTDSDYLTMLNVFEVCHTPHTLPCSFFSPCTGHQK